MAQPNTLFNNVRERAEKAVNRALERQGLTDAEIDDASDEFATSTYNAFFADCRSAGKTTSRCGALWNALKERDLAPTGPSAADIMDDDTTETATGTTDDTDVGRMPSTPGPETIDELEAEFRQADQVYLVVTSGCPSCNQAKEALSDWIDDGTIQVANVQTDDVAADIVIETNLDALPALVMEVDGRRAIV